MQPDICGAWIGPVLDAAIDVGVSLALAVGCTEPATVTLRGACIHEHVRQNRYCAKHGLVAPPDGVWLCRECAELGHDCPLTVEVVPDAAVTG